MNCLKTAFLIAVSSVVVTGCGESSTQSRAAAEKKQSTLYSIVNDDIETRVANDAVEQYEIANRSGTGIDKCVHAGFVAAAWLQAKNEENYKKWKSIQRSDCAKAGLPYM